MVLRSVRCCQSCQDHQDDDKNDFQYHHEDTDVFELKFRSNRENLLAAFEEFGNPFNECESNLMKTVSKVVLGEILLRTLCLFKSD